MILGVDIGTSNIKFVWCDGEKIIREKSYPTLEAVVGGLSSDRKEQSPTKILEILDNALLSEDCKFLQVKEFFEDIDVFFFLRL